MTTIDQARAALERATATRRAAADVWAKSRDLLDMGPFLDALAAENAAADFYHFCRDLEDTCLNSFTTFRSVTTSSWTACRRQD